MVTLGSMQICDLLRFIRSVSCTNNSAGTYGVARSAQREHQEREHQQRVFLLARAARRVRAILLNVLELHGLRAQLLAEPFWFP